MVQPLFAAVTRRQPFRVLDLPLVGQLNRAAFTRRRRWNKRLIGKPAQKLFRLLYKKTSLGGEGRMTLDLGGRPVQMRFNARNTQFNALYLPQYRDGYEPETTALLDLLCGDDALFLDIGANWGFFTLYLAARPGFAGRVHAIEPMPDSFADLASLVRQAGLSERVTCHEIALSDQDGQGFMRAEDVHSGLARLGETAGARPVRLARLDSFDLGRPPAALKIDVEGHEAAVLSGAAQTLRAHRPFVVFESWIDAGSPHVTLDPFRALDRQDYAFFQATWWTEAGEDGHATERPTGLLAVVPFLPEQRFLLAEQMNVLACPRDRLDDLAARFSV